MKTVRFLGILLCLSACGTGSNSTNVKSDIAIKSMTDETVMTCEQDDGDQWKSVGIGLTDGPDFIAYVVDNNDDDNSHKLVLTKMVTESTKEGVTTYSDKLDTFKLTVSTMPDSERLIGKLSILRDGPGSISLSDLECYENAIIEFDIQN